jgi:hypothetical protein
MIDRRLPPEERHSPEPEIIPPGNEDGSEAENPVWGRGTIEEHSIHRIYVTKVGPFGLLPLMLLGGVIAIAMLAFLFGFLLIFIPLVGLILAAALIGSFLRGGPRWPR